MLDTKPSVGMTMPPLEGGLSLGQGAEDKSPTRAREIEYWI